MEEGLRTVPNLLNQNQGSPPIACSGSKGCRGKVFHGKMPPLMSPQFEVFPNGFEWQVGSTVAN